LQGNRFKRTTLCPQPKNMIASWCSHWSRTPKPSQQCNMLRNSTPQTSYAIPDCKVRPIYCIKHGYHDNDGNANSAVTINTRVCNHQAGHKSWGFPTNMPNPGVSVGCDGSVTSLHPVFVYNTVPMENPHPFRGGCMCILQAYLLDDQRKSEQGSNFRIRV
jgi:hypothetical protein